MSGGMWCIFWKQHLRADQLDWRKNQTAVSHSTEAETISLDGGLRLEGILALGWWDTVIDVLKLPAWRNPMHNKSQVKKSLKGEEEHNGQH